MVLLVGVLIGSNCAQPATCMQSANTKFSEIVKRSSEKAKSALLLAVCQKGNTERALLLINNGANINTQGSSGDTSLYNTCYNNNPELAKFLIENGADVNIGNKFGAYPIDWVLKHNNAELFKALLLHKNLKFDIERILATNNAQLIWLIKDKLINDKKWTSKKTDPEQNCRICYENSGGKSTFNPKKSSINLNCCICCSENTGEECIFAPAESPVKKIFTSKEIFLTLACPYLQKSEKREDKSNDIVHVFHRNCLKQWIQIQEEKRKSRFSCPICNGEWLCKDFNSF